MVAQAVGKLDPEVGPVVLRQQCPAEQHALALSPFGFIEAGERLQDEAMVVERAGKVTRTPRTALSQPAANFDSFTQAIFRLAALADGPQRIAMIVQRACQLGVEALDLIVLGELAADVDIFPLAGFGSLPLSQRSGHERVI